MAKHLRVVRSCGESWDAMTPRGETGRHCASCDKTVVDLRGLTRVEAYAKVEQVKRARGSVCGRAEADPETNELRFAPAPVAPQPVRRLARGALLAAALMAGCDVAREPAGRALAIPAAHLVPLPPSKPEGFAAPPVTPDAGVTPPDAGTTTQDAGTAQARGRHHRRNRLGSAPPVVPPQPPYEIMGDMAM